METDPIYREKHEMNQRFLKPIWESMYKNYVAQADAMLTMGRAK